MVAVRETYSAISKHTVSMPPRMTSAVTGIDGRRLGDAAAAPGQPHEIDVGHVRLPSASKPDVNVTDVRSGSRRFPGRGASSNRSNSKPGDTVQPTSVHAPKIARPASVPGPRPAAGVRRRRGRYRARVATDRPSRLVCSSTRRLRSGARSRSRRRGASASARPHAARSRSRCRSACARRRPSARATSRRTSRLRDAVAARARSAISSTSTCPPL